MELNDILSGLVADIFSAERAHFLYKEIGTNAKEINESRKKFGHLFGAFQSTLMHDVILSVSRLYDRPSESYPTRCIHELLNHLKENIETLPKINDKYNLHSLMTDIGIEMPELKQGDDSEDKAITLAIIKHFSEFIASADIQNSLVRLKNVRDKTVAHNEHVHAINGPTWDMIVELIETAKQLVGCIGCGYADKIYYHEGRYINTENAKKPSRALLRLLREVEILPKNTPTGLA